MKDLDQLLRSHADFEPVPLGNTTPCPPEPLPPHSRALADQDLEALGALLLERAKQSALHVALAAEHLDPAPSPWQRFLRIIQGVGSPGMAFSSAGHNLPGPPQENVDLTWQPDVPAQLHIHTTSPEPLYVVLLGESGERMIEVGRGIVAAGVSMRQALGTLPPGDSIFLVVALQRPLPAPTAETSVCRMSVNDLLEHELVSATRLWIRC